MLFPTVSLVSRTASLFPLKPPPYFLPMWPLHLLSSALARSILVSSFQRSQLHRPCRWSMPHLWRADPGLALCGDPAGAGLGSPLRGTLPPLLSLSSDLPTLFLQGMTLPSPSFPDTLSSSYHTTQPSPQINIHRSFPFMPNSSTIKTPLGMARTFRARLRCGPPCPADSHSVLTLAGPGTGSVLPCAYTLPASSAARASLSGVSCQLCPANLPPSAPSPVWAAAQPPSRSPL